MRDVWNAIETWLDAGEAVALATVVRTWGSAPRPSGSKMAVSRAGEMAGSVSGGCVEGAVVEEALRALKTGRPKLLSFGVSDEVAGKVGLACGGQIEVFVEPLAELEKPLASGRSLLEGLREIMETEEPAARVVVIRGPGPLLGRNGVIRRDGPLHGELDPDFGERVHAGALEALGSGIPESRLYFVGGQEVEVFFDLLLPPPTLVLVGAVHIAMVLSHLAKVIGYRVVVVDPRRVFATAERFPQADGLLHMWPDEGLRQAGLTQTTAVAILSHDPKLDDPALMVALRSPAFYIGVLGSRETHAQRRQRLLQAGMTETDLARLHAPIGIDVGGETPEEIAVSILADVVAARRGLETARLKQA